MLLDQRMRLVEQLTSLIHMADATPPSLQLSASGRYNVLIALSKVAPALWDDPSWVIAKASARWGIMQLQGKIDGCTLNLGDQSAAALATLKKSLDIGAPTRPVHLQYGDMSAADANAIAAQLKVLGWNVLGTDGRPQVQTAARGKNEVRYGNAGDQAQAALLSADIKMMGRSMRDDPNLVSVIGTGPLEVWISGP